MKHTYQKSESCVGGTSDENLTDNPAIGLLFSYSMNQWEGKFAFCEVLSETFIHGVLIGLKIHVVVSDLKVNTDEVDEGYIISAE